MSETSSVGKWVGGVLATVIAGFLLWWLTGPLSPFNPSKNSIKINDVQKPSPPYIFKPSEIQDFLNAATNGNVDLLKK